MKNKAQRIKALEEKNEATLKVLADLTGVVKELNNARVLTSSPDQLKHEEAKLIVGVEFSFYDDFTTIINGKKDLYNTNHGWMVSLSGKSKIKPAHLVEVKERTVGRVYLQEGYKGRTIEVFSVWDGDVGWAWSVDGGVEKFEENDISHFEVQPI
jgi:hypothetical protein